MTVGDKTEAERVAGRLTKAQRRWLADAFYGRDGWRIVGFRAKACELGLCHPQTSRLTPFGLEVRATPTQEGTEA